MAAAAARSLLPRPPPLSFLPTWLVIRAGNGGRCGAFALAAAHLRRHDVVVQRFEFQQAGGHRAVERERRAVPGGRTQRVLVGDVPCRGYQPHVVDERLGIGPEPKPERRGHGDLQVGVSRHQHRLVTFAEFLQPVEDDLHGVGRLPQFVAQEQFEVHQHLVVARTPRMDLLARIAQSAGEHQLDLRMDVLGTGLDLETPGLDLRGDLPEPRRQRRELFGGQQPDFFQHGDMGQRPLDVITCQPHIQLAVVAHGVFLDHLVGFEPLIPKFSSHIPVLIFRCNFHKRRFPLRSPRGVRIRPPCVNVTTARDPS